MSRWSRFVPVFAIVALIAACGESGTDTPLAPSSPAPRFDGGWVVGGNATDSVPSTQTTQSDPSESPELPADSTNRGGWVVGGN